MKVFISGPISGTDDYKKRFKAAEEKIRNDGDTPVNPVKLTKHLPEDTPWETYMAITLAALKSCEAIYLLNGWRDSYGAHIECLWADRMAKIIFHEVS